ncbi:hypothetical protein ZYGR_0AS04770 [Zygosaccharomyces rouxii]|uniref:Meiosis protein 5 n=1 Tax=Zygosaccharomyces rouxii TaxID=4956 RepID=A0A1Q3AI36_ZYGRO|nr:hypothetical protein ZYGR_0AS04770 [Zygosaccharomyces rouxii]
MDSNTPSKSSPSCTPIPRKKSVFRPPVKSSQQTPSTPNTLVKTSVNKAEKGSIEDRKLANELKLLNNEYARQIHSYKMENNQIEQATKVLKNYEQELKVMKLIDKWRSISQGGMSYLLNSTMLKINRIGGYEELKRKEMEAEKRKIEYQMDNSLQDEMDNVLESEEFQMLPEEDQEEYKKRMEDKMEEMEVWKERKLSKLEEQVKLSANQEMTMQELAERLKVDYKLVFSE